MSSTEVKAEPSTDFSLYGVTLVLRCAESLRANADDRLSLDPLGRIERRNGIIEGRDIADDRSQTSVPHPLDNSLSCAIGHDNEVDRQAVRRPGLRRAGDRHQPSSGSDQPCRALPDVTAEHVEHQIDSADVFQ